MAKRTIRKERNKKTYSKKLSEFDLKTFYGEEPDVEGKKLTKFELTQVLNWYNYVIKQNKKKEWFLKWAGENNKDVKFFEKVHEKYFNSLGAVARIISLGAILSEDDLNSFESNIQSIPELVESEKKEKDVKGIRDVKKFTKEKIASYIGEIECYIDDFIESGYKKSFNIKEFIINNEIKPILSLEIGKYFKSLSEEIERSLNPENEYEWESYSHLTKSQKKKMVDFISDIFFEFEQKKKVVRKERKPRKTKEKSPKDIVKNVKYLNSCSELNLESIKPHKIVGAKEVWIYNTKYKKLSVIKAIDEIRGLDVKGTTIQHFDETNSVEKALRKPVEFFESMKDVNKSRLNKLFGLLKTKPKKPTGRLNDKCLIYKVMR